ncbi:hypothetical protein TrLO_g7719 [Triparma laevis f. longispina]|uniref:S-adenosyl-L-methionine-dependent methyltransferase n=1 Tax=Triparma laevis f. longispina TaxID=1714387 RepID=A0A9W7AW32_9STRA|nr:hypothetical protein TrLO_g7719 [Triparma laevis f. longispina]
MMAPKAVWKFAWDAGKVALRVLPRLTRSYVPVDSNVNLSVLYWKAIGGDETARKMLPGRLSRVLTARGVRMLYPRLHHQNVKIRSKYIDTRIKEIVEEMAEDVLLKILIVGSGFDSRGVKLIEEYSDRDIEVYEFDLPKVIEEKRIVLNQSKLDKGVVGGLRLGGVDLNEIDEARGILLEVIRGGRRKQQQQQQQRVVIVLEAVIIYVDDPTAVLNLLAEVLRESGSGGTLVFADRLPKEQVSYANEGEAGTFLGDLGYELMDFLPKPGLASSMGVAKIKSE